MPQKNIMIKNLALFSQRKDSSVEQLLVKFLDVANFLKLNEFNHWLFMELNGYFSSQEIEVPLYRITQGVALCKKDDFSIPAFEIDNPILNKILSEVKIFDPVPELEIFINERRTQYKVLLTEKQMRVLSRLTTEPADSFCILLNRGQIAHVLNEIKLTAKQWIAELQSNT